MTDDYTLDAGIGNRMFQVTKNGYPLDPWMCFREKAVAKFARDNLNADAGVIRGESVEVTIKSRIRHGRKLLAAFKERTSTTNEDNGSALPYRVAYGPDHRKYRG